MAFKSIFFGLVIALGFFIPTTEAVVVQAQLNGYRILVSPSKMVFTPNSGKTMSCLFVVEQDGIDDDNLPYTAMFFRCNPTTEMMLKVYNTINKNRFMMYNPTNNKPAVIDEIFDKSIVQTISNG